MYDPTVVWYKKMQRKRNVSSLRRSVSKEEMRTVLRIIVQSIFGSLLTPHQRCCLMKSFVRQILSSQYLVDQFIQTFVWLREIYISIYLRTISLTRGETVEVHSVIYYQSKSNPSTITIKFSRSHRFYLPSVHQPIDSTDSQYSYYHSSPRSKSQEVFVVLSLFGSCQINSLAF